MTQEVYVIDYNAPNFKGQVLEPSATVVFCHNGTLFNVCLRDGRLAIHTTRLGGNDALAVYPKAANAVEIA